MRLNITTPVMLLVSFLVSSAGTTSAEEGTAYNPAPATVEQAKVKADAIVAKANEPGKIPSDFRARWGTELLCLLDSEDAEIRAVAIEKFFKLSLIRLDECIPYLNGKRLPLTERMPLLVLCAKQFLGDGAAYSSQEARAEAKEAIRGVCDQEICPPMFGDMAAALALNNGTYLTSRAWFGVPISEFISDGKASLAARRFLATISEVQQAYTKAKQPYYHRVPEKLFDMVISLGEKHAGPAIEEWYQIEADPDARRVVVAENLHWSQQPEWKERRKAILKLAAKDWDEEIAAKAKALLAEME